MIGCPILSTRQRTESCIFQCVVILFGALGWVFGFPRSLSPVGVKASPQMTRFRDAKVCNNWLQMKIDDHRIQSDNKCKSGLQHPEGKTLHLVLRLRGDDARQTRPTPVTT